MTADPRIAENARPLICCTYTEVCNMAYQGAKVIHPRAVEIAMQAKVPIRIRSTYSDKLRYTGDDASHIDRREVILKNELLQELPMFPMSLKLKFLQKKINMIYKRKCLKQWLMKVLVWILLIFHQTVLSILLQKK